MDEVYKYKDVLVHEIQELENIIDNYEIEVERMKSEIKRLRKNNEENENRLKEKDRIIDYLSILTGGLNLDLIELEKSCGVDDDNGNNVVNDSKSDKPIEYRISYDEVAVEKSKDERWIDIKNDVGKVIARVNVDQILIQKPCFYQKIESNGEYDYRPEQGYAAMSCMPLKVDVEKECVGLRNEWAFTGIKKDYVCRNCPGLNEIGNILYKPAYCYNEFFKVLSNNVVVSQGQANRIIFEVDKEVLDKDVVYSCSGELVYDNNFKRFILFFVDLNYEDLEGMKFPMVKSLRWGMQGEFFKLSNYMNLVVKRIRECGGVRGEVFELYLYMSVQKCNRFSSYSHCDDRISINTKKFNCDSDTNSNVKNVYFNEKFEGPEDLWACHDLENFFWNVNQVSYEKNRETIKSCYGKLKYLVIQENVEEYKDVFNVLMRKFKDYSSGRVFNSLII